MRFYLVKKYKWNYFNIWKISGIGRDNGIWFFGFGYGLKVEYGR